MRWLETTLIVAALALVIPFSLLTDWNKILVFGCSALMLGVINFFFSRLYIRRLADESDSLFLQRYSAKFGSPYAKVLAERQRLASLLGLPAEKLTVETRLGNLRKQLSLLDQIGFLVGLGDLENSLFRRRGRRSGIEGLWTRTIGEVVQAAVDRTQPGSSR